MPSDRLNIREIYNSIQGESTWAGLPCVFVRLAGCHLRCVYCDSAFAFSGGQSMSLESIVEEAQQLGGKLVQITGGEPLLQTACSELMRRFCDLDWTVLLETSGSCDIREVDERVHRIVDIKTPSSGEGGSFDLANMDALTVRDEVKFVITDREDFEWASVFVSEHRLATRAGAVLFAPVSAQASGEVAGCAGLAPSELAAWLLDSKTPARLQLQMHKVIWDPQERGR